MQKKIKKLFRDPGLFFRDFFLKKYPLCYNELGIKINNEISVIQNEELLSLSMEDDEKYPVDIVYTWVDGSDKKWMSSYEKTLQRFDASNFGVNACSAARFSNHNELEYSLRSIMKYMPWVNTIFIVTSSQTPPRHILNSKCKIINHHDIIDDKYLPTFNSHVIEAHIHAIEELHEHFIYFNDDVFVMRPLSVSHFFRSKSVAVLRRLLWN